MTESDDGVNDSGPDIPHDAKATFDCIISHLGGFPVSAERLKEVDWAICRFLVGQRELLLFPKAVRRKRKLAPIRVPEPEAHPCDLAWFCLAQSPLLHACALCVVFVPPALTIRKYLAAKEQLFRPASKFVEPAVKVAHLSEWFPKFWVRWLDRSDIRTHALVFGSALARTLYELSGIGIQRLSAVADLTKVTQPRAKTLGSIWARTATEAILKASLDATGFLGYQAGLSKIQGRLSGETLTHAGHAWAWAVGNGLRRRLPAATDDDAKPLVQELDYEMHAALGRGIVSSPFPEGEVLAESSATKRCRHSDDFTSVIWFGTKYDFAKGQQAESVRLLWAEWEKGELGLSEKTIGEGIGSNNDRFRLVHTFRNRGGNPHPAWGTMIQSVGKGIFALRPPETSPPTK